MTKKKLAFLMFFPLAVGACSEKTTFDGKGAFVSDSTVSEAQYAEINRIPERASDRRASAYEGFMERSRVASYLLDHELADKLSLQVELQEALNRKVADAYFEDFLESKLSEVQIKEYYEKHQAQFSERDYVVSRILVRSRSKSEKDTDLPAEIAQSLQKALANGGDLNKAIKMAEQHKDISISSEESIKLDSNNINPQISTALSELKEGDVSAVLPASRGVQLFRVDKIIAQERPFEEVAGKIKYQLGEELKRKEYQRLAMLTRSQ